MIDNSQGLKAIFVFIKIFTSISVIIVPINQYIYTTIYIF